MKPGVKLNLPTLTNNQSSSLQEFISFWSKLYVYDTPVLYERVHNNPLSVKDLKDLYKWKNGMKLSQAKEKSLNTKIISKIGLINGLRSAPVFDLEHFLKEFKEVSVVWKVFLLHILKPNRFPIYDQHVHRAYRFINNQSSDRIKASIKESEKFNFYFKEYYPFVVQSKILNLKKMDEAFFAFGQFINIGNQKILAS